MQMHSVDVVLVMAWCSSTTARPTLFAAPPVSFATECVPSTGPR
ncbi:Uncharacterised protein [Pseudomonas aeruginosa]|uniref:Uncharacterized protein n=1 Tax=Pseudomonas paraeruginosa TaxID=2994495 RepID=A0A2R3IZV6_9PSED|nr:hypothetical protein [Pseudomonas aeruginosa]AVK07441.1 hypothetical protein CSB93_3925 [Pseudomonas paraeruginosa]VTS60985.1 Uncharacterised protein [Streptococcus dysgalactiae subsp. equisimilis]AWE93716.1 hypothetical protein CSC28_2708 [Pseudomonas paraeruginosa]MCT9633567.1 hypothetical protein [Pseudomonas aeruginosa]PTC36850.1 hypothetical protein CLJ1_2611 [Pseudomonas aeruginosa]